MKKADASRTLQQQLNAQELQPQGDEKNKKGSSHLFDVALKVYEIFGRKKSGFGK